MVKRPQAGTRISAIFLLGLAAAGPAGADSCTACHVKGAPPAMGQLQGQPVEDLIRKMEAFRSGKEAGTTMRRIVRGFPPDEVRDLAFWFSKQ